MEIVRNFDPFGCRHSREVVGEGVDRGGGKASVGNGCLFVWIQVTVVDGRVTLRKSVSNISI